MSMKSWDSVGGWSWSVKLDVRILAVIWILLGGLGRILSRVGYGGNPRRRGGRTVVQAQVWYC